MDNLCSNVNQLSILLLGILLLGFASAEVIYKKLSGRDPSVVVWNLALSLITLQIVIKTLIVIINNIWIIFVVMLTS